MVSIPETGGPDRQICGAMQISRLRAFGQAIARYPRPNGIPCNAFLLTGDLVSWPRFTPSP